MAKDLKKTLETIEHYKGSNPHYQELLEILSEILILREDHRRKFRKNIFPVNEDLIETKLRGGLPIIDFGADNIDLAKSKELFFQLLEIGKVRNPEETVEILKDFENGSLVYEKLVHETFTFTGEREAPEGRTPESFDLLRFFLEESLRPALEVAAEKYSDRVANSQWNEGYCPVCGRIPKIGELREEEGRRFLFCSQCSTRWKFKRVKCPFCGNEEQQTLAYFSVEGDEKYRVDVCDNCKRYIKTVDFRTQADEPNLDVEDIATLHLDILAHEEGYN